MIFTDRADAGRQLARQLAGFAGREGAIVLGIPRGGVVVAAEIAKALRLPLDVFLAHKLGVPAQPELAFGAVAEEGIRYLDQEMVRHQQIQPETIDRIAAEVQALLEKRSRLYRGSRPPPEIAGKTILLVDDGIATGASIFAAVLALHQLRPAELILAVPVAPAATCSWLRKSVDQLICLLQPANFLAVGEFFADFSQTSDQEVARLLAENLETVQSKVGLGGSGAEAGES